MVMAKKFAIVFVFISMVPAVCSAEDGPFGLSWGMTKEQVEKLGVKLELSSTKMTVDVLTTEKLPKNVSIAEKYTLIFDRKHNFQKVIMVSKDIGNDPYGNEGKEKYAELKKSLIAKYGKPSFSFEKVGRKLWNEKDEFYQCLAYTGCGGWVVSFEDKASGQVIGLQLEGIKRGIGFLRLTYEGPRWSEIVDAARAAEAQSDKDAL
jgi:hypothetical protein